MDDYNEFEQKVYNINIFFYNDIKYGPFPDWCNQTISTHGGQTEFVYYKDDSLYVHEDSMLSYVYEYHKFDPEMTWIDLLTLMFDNYSYVEGISRIYINKWHEAMMKFVI